jgi:hypothetical protein
MRAISSATAAGFSWSTTSADPDPPAAAISSPVSSIVSGRPISDGPAFRLLRPCRVDEEAGASELDRDRPAGTAGCACDERDPGI